MAHGLLIRSLTKLADKHKAALISAIEEVVMTTDDANPSSNTTYGYVTQTWPLNRGIDLASELLGRHNLSDAGEAVVDNYESVSSIGNEVEIAVVELHESKIESNGGVRILLEYEWLMVCWSVVWLNLLTSTKQPWLVQSRKWSWRLHKQAINIYSLLHKQAIYIYSLLYKQAIYIYSLLHIQAWTFRMVRGLYLQPKSTFFSIA